MSAHVDRASNKGGGSMKAPSGITSSFAGSALIGFLSLAAMLAPAAAADGVRFLVFGDSPYTQGQLRILEDTIAPAIQAAGIPFVIHHGDMKASGEPCTDALVTMRYDQLMGLHPGRVFYTPGDNEWTDCDRPDTKNPAAKPLFAEVERLDFLRGLILSRPLDLSADWRYATQPDYPENARWTQQDVMFATIHIVSTNNGREQILLDDIETTLDLVDARDAANLSWLEATFAAAGELGSGAVVITIQADVTVRAGPMPCGPGVRVQCDAFALFRDALLRHAAGFRKPVLLIHGDTNPFCLDRKFGGNSAPLLWRLNALGDYSEVDATAITVRPNDPDAPFAIAPLSTGASVGRSCP
jgi:hypothetical protein